MILSKSVCRAVSISVAAVMLCACSGGGGGDREPSAARYTITASAGTGGTISPSGTVRVTAGGTQSFAVAPASGYAIGEMVVDGMSQGAVTTYTFSNILADHEIAVSFVVDPVDNRMPVTVNGALCSAGSYVNKPCVSVRVCSPDGSSCQTIDDILLDTASYGLRVFASVLTVPLTQMASGTGSLAECIKYGDGSSQWGPVKMAMVTLANEPAVQVPIQVIDATFGTVPSSCSSPDSTPMAAGFNGILGIGFFAEDCGSVCVERSDVGFYYSCSAGTCTPASAPLAAQVKNPVAFLPTDNNGLIVHLETVGSLGAESADGFVLFGIGTRSTNVPSTTKVFPVEGDGTFSTIFGGRTYNSFIDTGSNGLFIETRAIQACMPPNAEWFCPPLTTTYAATNTGAGGTPTATASFDVGNVTNLMSTGNSVFSNIGGYMPGFFDWGLPFHFGKTIYLGIENKGSPIGQGPYWAQ